MYDTPTQLFRAFLAKLRETGTEIPLDDNEVALLLRDGLEILQPMEDKSAAAATNLFMDFDVIATEAFHQILIERAS